LTACRANTRRRGLERQDVSRTPAQGVKRAVCRGLRKEIEPRLFDVRSVTTARTLRSATMPLINVTWALVRFGHRSSCALSLAQ
jgi:hypothetical protein